MSETTPAWTEDPLLIAFTPLRRVTVRESPYAGTLVRSPTGVHLLVDPDQIPVGELFWTPREDTHVLRAIDAVHMGASGSDAATGALVEACREPLEVYIDAREAARAPLTPAECATIMISLLRGVSELRTAGGREACGAWWLSSTARPVFAILPGGERADAGACRILRRLRVDDAHGGAALEAIIALVLADDARSGGIDACERAVFEWAEPGPLRPCSDADAPMRLPPSAGAADGDAAWRSSPVASRDIEPGAFDRLVRGGDGGWQETLSDVAASARGALRALRRTPVTDRPRRRGRILAATAVVGAVLAGAFTVFVPGSESPLEEVAVAGPRGTASPDASLASAPDSAGEQAEAAATDLPRVTAQMLDAVTTCAGDAACIQTIAERADLTVSAGAATAPAIERSLHLVDEYGDVAVIRAEADGYAPQLIVVARHDDRWLLREVLDLAQQPSS